VHREGEGSDPGETPSEPRPRPPAAWMTALRGTAEPAFAVIFASTLTLALTVPLLPTAVEAEMPLRAAGGPGTVLPATELASRVAALGLARRVEVVLKDGTDHLVLYEAEEGVDRRLAQAAREAGYLERDVVERRVLSLERLLERDPRALSALLSIQTVVFLVTGLLLARLRARVVPVRKATALGAIATGVVGGLIALAASAAISGLLELAGLPVQEQEWLRQLFADGEAVVWLAPWILLFGPIAEEVFFRRYAFRAIAGRAGLPAGLVASSVLFALIHFNPSGFLIYLAIGVVLAAVYQRTGSLLAPVAGHVTVNAVVLVAAMVVGPSAV